MRKVRRSIQKIKKNQTEKTRGDKTLFIVIMALVIFGTIMIFSGSVPIATYQELPPYYYFFKQLQFFVIGLIIFFITYNINYHLYPKIIVPALLITIFLLIVVLFTPTINDTHRWLDLKIIKFQISDVAKLTMTLYLASWLSKDILQNKNRQINIRDYLSNNLFPFLLILGTISVLILVQPDLSTSVLIGMISLSIYFISGTDIFNIIGTIGIGISIGLFGLLAGIISPYRFDRIRTFFDFLGTGTLGDPFGRDYQLRQILIAVGTGKIFGQGFAQSKQKFSYLTETAFSDSIFAVFSEEFGFLGSIILISIFLWIMFRGLKIAKHAPDKLGSLTASGIIIWITLQAFIHFAVNVGLIPLTGIPLPFMSYGGSSLIVSMAAIGILMNISRYCDLEN